MEKIEWKGWRKSFENLIFFMDFGGFGIFFFIFAFFNDERALFRQRMSLLAQLMRKLLEIKDRNSGNGIPPV